jgi:hypothetical protein
MDFTKISGTDEWQQKTVLIIVIFPHPVNKILIFQELY